MTTSDLVLAELMEQLNSILTENSIERVRSVSRFDKTIEQYLFDPESAYYLADSGYSRLCWAITDDGQGKLVLADVSLEGPKSRWNDPEVVDLRNQTESVIRSWIEDCFE